MKKKDILSYLLLGILLFIAFTFLWNYKTTIPWIADKAAAVLVPLLGGICVAFVMNIPARFLEKHISSSRCRFIASHSRSISIFLSVLFLILFVALIVVLVLPELINAVSLIVSSLRDFARDSHFWNEVEIDSIPVLNSIFDSADTGILTLADAIESKINEWTPSIVSFTLSTMRSFIASAVTFFVSFVFAIYFLANKERLQRHITKFLSLFLKENKLDYLKHTAHVSYVAFSRFILAQVTEAVIIGLLCFAGMLIFRFPYAPAIAALTGAMALIPIYGAVIGALVGAFLIAVINPWKGLFFLIFIFVLQQLEGDLIYPRVVGTSTGVPSVYVFAAVTLGGALFGLPGMLFAVPVFSIVYTLLKELYYKKQNESIEDNADKQS